MLDFRLYQFTVGDVRPIEIKPTFGIRAEKRLFLGMNFSASLDFQGVNFQNGLELFGR